MKVTKFTQSATPVVYCEFTPEEVRTKKVKIPKNLKSLAGFNKETAHSLGTLNKYWKDFFFGKETAQTFTDVLEGRSRIPKPANKGTRVTNKTRRRKVYSEFDGVLDIDRYIDGCNDIYTRKTRRRGTPKINLYIHLSAAHQIKGDKIKEFLTAIVKEVYQYIARGNQVAIYAVSGSNNLGAKRDHDALTVQQIKKSNKPLDFQKLASIAKSCYYRYFTLKAKLLAADALKIGNNGNIGTATGGATAFELTKQYAMKREPYIFYDFDTFKRSGKLVYAQNV